MTMTQKAALPLSADEEITLRRVAYGQSEVTSLRAQDLLRLRDLKLIEGSAREPILTADGKRCFDALPRAATQMPVKPGDDMLAGLARMLDRQARK